MNIFKQIEQQLHALVEALKQSGQLPASATTDKIEATPARDPLHGDIATNAAMVLAAQTGKNPREIAQLLLEPIRQLPQVAKAEIAGPGFINLTFAPAFWQEAMLGILAQGRHYGDSNLGKGQRVNIEYVSANPTGPMHVGHGRGAVFGDALAALLAKAGYDVTREYYINDAGAQVDKLAESAYLRYREACGEKIGAIPEGYYPGDYLIPIGQELYKLHGNALLGAPRERWLALVRDFTLATMMDIIKGDLAVLGIYHSVFTSEQAIRNAGEVEKAVQLLENKGLVYEGMLQPPKGKPTPEDWEPRPQILFRSTQFGDDADRPIKKSDGSWAYFTPDIAYHYNKLQRGFKKMVLVLGADHVGYQKRLQAAVAALSGGEAELMVKLCQLVKFLRNGQPAKMSKRANSFVTIREVVDEVGKDAFRFIMLTRKNDAPLDFDFAKVLEQSRDNPVFYVQYAHARTRSIRRLAEAEMPEAYALAQQPDRALVSLLIHPEELSLIRQLCTWPRLVEAAALSLEPHRVAFYLQELAASFHGLWNAGNGDLGLRFLVKSDIRLTAARVALAQAVSHVIASGLVVLGVEPVEELRG